MLLVLALWALRSVEHAGHSVTLIGAAEPPTPAGWLAGNAAVGPLDSQRIFYDGALPTTYRDSTCARLEAAVQGAVTCVISYKDPDTSTNNVASFVSSIPAGINVWLVFHHEPEDEDFTGSGTSGANFVADFVRNTAAVRSAASCEDCHIKVGMAANVYQYHQGPPADRGIGCSYIPPAASVDAYLADVYEPVPDGRWLASGPVARQWNNWLRCVSDADRRDPHHHVPLGIAEYGLGTAAGDDVRARTIAADHLYLANHFPGLVMWEYWDLSRWVLRGHPAAAAAWREVVAAY